MPTVLNTPIIEGGLDRTPFFNGRVLTAEDLKTEQKANATERKRLGRALGTGVIEGLFVDRVNRESDAPPTTVAVESGLALAPSGRVVELPSEVELSVVSEIDREETAGTKGRFASCSAREVVVTSGTGAYLLFVEPAAEPRGRTPRTRLGGDGAASECGAQYRREGAQLRLVHLDTSDGALVPSPLADGEGEYDIQNLSEKVSSARENDEEPMSKHVSKLRNVLAHVCLRTPSTFTETADLYDTLRAQSRGNASGTDGPVAELRDRIVEQNDRLKDAVPIALLYWARDRIEFVDVWSVRRRVHRSDPQWPPPATARRRAETEAAIYQFQDHMSRIVAEEADSGVVDIQVTEHFRFLPPISAVPKANSSGSAGVVPESFLEDYPARSPIGTEGRRIPSLLKNALDTPPVDLTRRTALRTYSVQENVMLPEGRGRMSPSDKRAGTTPYLLLVDGSLPFIGDPRFNLAHYEVATFADPADR